MNIDWRNFVMNIENLFKDEEDVDINHTTDGEDDVDESTDSNTGGSNNTDAISVEEAARNSVARELGYDNYEALQKAKTEKLIASKGFNPKDVEEVINPIVEARINSDERIKKLEMYEAREKAQYIESALSSINDTTGQNLKLDDLGKDTIELWEKGIELEQAYYATRGKELINTRGSNNRGTLNHMVNVSGAGRPKTRGLTEAEKDIWRSVSPDVSEEELAKKTITL